MSKKVYLVQVNVTYSSTIAYLPYAAGCLAAYAWNDEEIKKNFELADIICIRHKPEENLEKIVNPAVVGFSCYVWNMEYNLLLARMIKEKHPECLIVFGGHNVPDDTSLLEKHSFIDVLMHSEGEEPFSLMLKAVADGSDFFGIPDISFRNGDSIITTEKKRIYDISEYPSPYTTGMFDPIIEEYPYIRLWLTVTKNKEMTPYQAIQEIGFDAYEKFGVWLFVVSQPSTMRRVKNGYANPLINPINPQINGSQKRNSRASV